MTALPYYFAPQLAVSPQKLNQDLLILDGRTANIYPISQYGGIADDGSSSPANNIGAITKAYQAAAAGGGGIVYFDALYSAWPATRTTTFVVDAPNITFMGSGWNTGIRIPRQSGFFPFACIGLTKNSTNFVCDNMVLYGPQIAADAIGELTSQIVRCFWICKSDGLTEEDDPFIANWYFHRVYWGCWNGTQGWAVAYNGEAQTKVTFFNCTVNSQISDLELYGYAFNIAGHETTIENCDFYPINGNLARHANYTGDPASSVRILNNRYLNLSREAVTSNQVVLNSSSDILIQGNTFTDCVGVGAPVVTGVIDISGWHDFKILNNTLITNDRVNWGQTSGICTDYDQELTNRNLQGIVANNCITGFQRHGIDIENADYVEVHDNILEDVGLDTESASLHVELSTNVRFRDNKTIVNGTNVLNALVYIDTSAPIPDSIVATGNSYVLNGTSSITSEFLNFDVATNSYARSGNTPGTSRPAFDQTTTPSLQSGIPYVISNNTDYTDITDFTNPQDGQVFQIRAYSLPVRVKNTGRIVLSSNNDVDLVADRALTLRYDGFYNQFYEIARPSPYEYTLPQPTGRVTAGGRSWNITPLQNGFAGWVSTNGGTALVAQDEWPLTASSGHAFAFDTRCWYGGNTYLAQSTGTCGGTPPTWTSGTHSDGAVMWKYLEPLALWSPFGQLAATVGGNLIGSSLDMRIRDTYANVDTTIVSVINLDNAANHAGEPVYFIKTNTGGPDMDFAPGPGDNIEGLAGYSPVGVIRLGLVGDGVHTWRVVSALTTIP